MKLALLSDLHANLPAFEACLAHAQAHGATDIAILGDLVGYGPHPGELVDRCIDLQSRGAIVLRGNHDMPPDANAPADGSWQALTARWTHDRLERSQQRWLATLDLTRVVGNVFLVHASADDPTRWRYVTDARIASLSLQAACRDPAVRYVVGGHVHQQQLFFEGARHQLMPFEPRAGSAIPVGAHRRWLATVGSVGQPRDGDPRAAYAVLDIDRRTLQFHRVDYDIDLTCAELRINGLPEALASRLEEGR